MLDVTTGDRAVPRLPIPTELEQALDPAWLTRALAPASGGAPVTWVGTTDRIETMAVKVLFQVRFGDDPELHHFCLKAFLGDRMSGAGLTAVREAKFYTDIAPHLTTRTPTTLSIIDEDAQKAVLLMDDMIHAGVHFCSALEPFTAEDAAGTLDQIARLHAGSRLLDANPWIPSRLTFLAGNPHHSPERQAELMRAPRFGRLSPATADAGNLLTGMKRLYDRFIGGPMTILHGDCHAGNFYTTAEGPGITDWQLVQRGNWAQDVAYHISAVLPVELAEREERALLDHYLDRIDAHGGVAPDRATAWEDFRAAQIYGYYHWAITVKVDPQITDEFVRRLGAAVDRHGTYRLLGLG